MVLSHGILQIAAVFSSASNYNTTPSAAVRGNGLCHFQIAFDYRPNITGSLDWGCVGSQNLISFPLELLRTPETYKILGMPPPLDDIMSFVTDANSTTFMNAVDGVQRSLYSVQWCGRWQQHRTRANKL
jgi:hypothetical protein